MTKVPKIIGSREDDKFRQATAFIIDHAPRPVFVEGNLTPTTTGSFEMILQKKLSPDLVRRLGGVIDLFTYMSIVPAAAGVNSCRISLRSSTGLLLNRFTSQSYVANSQVTIESKVYGNFVAGSSRRIDMLTKVTSDGLGASYSTIDISGVFVDSSSYLVLELEMQADGVLSNIIRLFNCQYLPGSIN